MDFVWQAFEETEEVLGTVQKAPDRGMYMCEGAFRARPPVLDPTITIYPIVQSNTLDIPALLTEYISDNGHGYYQRQDECREARNQEHANMRVLYYVEFLFTFSIFYLNNNILKGFSYAIHHTLSSAFKKPNCHMGHYSRSHLGEEDGEDENFYDSHLEEDIWVGLSFNLRLLIREILIQFTVYDPVINLLIRQGHLETFVNHIFTITFGNTKLSENALLLFENVFATDDLTPLEHHYNLNLGIATH